MICTNLQKFSSIFINFRIQNCVSRSHSFFGRSRSFLFRPRKTCQEILSTTLELTPIIIGTVHHLYYVIFLRYIYVAAYIFPVDLTERGFACVQVFPLCTQSIFEGLYKSLWFDSIWLNCIQTILVLANNFPWKSEACLIQIQCQNEIKGENLKQVP